MPLNPFPERLHNYLYQWEKARPDALFLAERRSGQQGWAKLSYGEAAQKARAIAQAIAARPLSENRPILILSGNGLDHALVALGAMTAGVPYAPISVAYSLVSQDLGKLRQRQSGDVGDIEAGEFNRQGFPAQPPAAA